MYEPVTIEKLYHDILNMKSGGCGKFQWIVSFGVMFGLISFGYIEYCISFLELRPQISCLYGGE